MVTALPLSLSQPGNTSRTAVPTRSRDVVTDREADHRPEVVLERDDRDTSDLRRARVRRALGWS